MVVAGVDIGSVVTKVVILENRKIKSQVLHLTGADPKLAAELSLKEALKFAGFSLGEIAYIVSTGYGRRAIEFGDKTITEISCCARGALWLGAPLGKIRTIIDLGGQDTKVISLDEDGGIIDFVMNDKCAAGTGRFLEVIAGALQVNLEKLGELALHAKTPIPISSICTVFTESEVVSLIAQRRSKEDIVGGICQSIATRIVGMVREIGDKETIFFVGGGAKNLGIKRALENKLKVQVYVPEEPQFVIAQGAALFADEWVTAKSTTPTKTS